ncbi:MAG: CDP-alcohol phosphatidyltransferase family protein, partial [Sphingobium limneticum]
MSQTITTTLGPVRLIGDNATPIWGMSNAERNRRMAESAAKNGSALAPGHELLFNLTYAFDPLLLRLVLETPGTLF